MTRAKRKRAVVRRKTPTTCYLRQDQLDALRVLNEHSRVPVAALIREGVDMVLEERLTPELHARIEKLKTD